MAEAISSKQDICMCSICLDLLKDPVTLSCGHNYCSGCINNHWDGEDEKRVYSCPQCRQTFTSRPVLKRNNIVAEIVGEMRKTTVKSDDLADHGDVECDICSGRKLKAVKSCLDCVLSYCETHFETHNKLHPSKEHSVVDALCTAQLHERICSRHKKALEVFCRTDQTCICLLCTMDQHKGHDTIAATAEWSKKKEKLGQIQTKYQQKIEKREKDVQELRRAVETLKSSAESAVEYSDQMFDDIILSVERRRSEVTELIRAQEKSEVSWAEGLLQRLEQEISELKKKVADMEKLSDTQDHIHFLKHIDSISDIPRTSSAMTLGYSNLSFDWVITFLSELKIELQEKLPVKISPKVATVQIQSEYTDPDREADEADRSLWWLSTLIWALSWIGGTTLPETREDLLQYYCHFTLDPNSAHEELCLFEGNRRVETGFPADLSYRDHPERFDQVDQVLCREGVSGRCYWEVEWSGEWVYIAVAYKTISRKGRYHDCWFGNNDQSWRLAVLPHCTRVHYNNEGTDLPLVASSRVGVYVDHRAGTLAFYSISDTITLLHKVQTTFSHTLYPGFAFANGSSAKLL